MGVTVAAPADQLDETALLAAVRTGDEQAFRVLVDRHHASLLRVARRHVSSNAVAEEVVQETWLAVVTGIDRFEGRSSLKTWIFRILLNIARTREGREQRTVPVTALTSADEPATDYWFQPQDGRVYGGWWLVHPTRWEGLPEDRAEAGELRRVVARAIADLPENQRQVIVLRDIERFSSDETCAMLDLTEGNQRVLLHRARTRVRRVLQTYFETECDAGGEDIGSGV